MSYRGLLTGKFKREDTNPAATLAGTRLGWTAEKPEGRTMGASPSVENYRNNEDYWTLMTAMETIGKKHGYTPFSRRPSVKGPQLNKTVC